VFYGLGWLWLWLIHQNAVAYPQFSSTYFIRFTSHHPKYHAIPEQFNQYQTLTNYVLTTATSALPAADLLMPFEWEAHKTHRERLEKAGEARPGHKTPCPPKWSGRCKNGNMVCSSRCVL